MNGAEGDIPALWQDFPVGLTVGYDLLSGTVGTVFKDAEVFCETGGNSGGNGPGRWNFTRSAGSTECVSVIIHLTRDKKFQQRKQGVLLHQLIPGDTGFRKIPGLHGEVIKRRNNRKEQRNRVFEKLISGLTMTAIAGSLMVSAENAVNGFARIRSWKKAKHYATPS